MKPELAIRKAYPPLRLKKAMLKRGVFGTFSRI